MRSYQLLAILFCFIGLATTGCSGDKANTVIVPESTQDSRVESYENQDPNQYSDRAAGTKNRP